MKRKPTKKEIDSDMSDIRVVISRLIGDNYELRSALHSYIEFNGDMDKWKDWIKKELQNNEISNKKASKTLKNEKVV